MNGKNSLSNLEIMNLIDDNCNKQDRNKEKV